MIMVRDRGGGVGERGRRGEEVEEEEDEEDEGEGDYKFHKGRRREMGMSWWWRKRLVIDGSLEHRSLWDTMYDTTVLTA